MEFFKGLALAVGGYDAADACAPPLVSAPILRYLFLMMLQLRARAERIAAAAAEPAGSGLWAAGATRSPAFPIFIPHRNMLRAESSQLRQRRRRRQGPAEEHVVGREPTPGSHWQRRQGQGQAEAGAG